MKGYILTIPVGGTPVLEEVGTASILSKLQDAVCGYIEQVPYFDNILWDGKVHKCVAFCNEEGKLKGLPVNDLASALWITAAKRYTGDVLVGTVVVVWGDRTFMKNL